MMSRVQKGLVAGLAATVAVSVLEAVNILALKWFAPFPLILAKLVGVPGNLAVGWVLHAIAGIFILGPLFGILCPRLPTDTPETKGIVFAVGAFVVLMVGLVLFGGGDVFGRNFGTIGWLVATHAVFGIVLGNVYARMVARDRRAVAPPGAAPAH
ncbi:MAG TPA: hypothetical protein PLQ03_00565 [Brevundimonas sp.]|uniref:DUF6789 family protein n=1 Tax=Brevundimonas sp. TaxID=1871086 RepID=UPI00260830DB|nr:DUF6789 family protein [Brevundimonas sp.]HRO31883.1 hypothetical protein [Brevundimonas sp.]